MSVLETYLNKKKKNISEYSKIINNFITLKEIKLWKNKAEFNRDLKEISSLYIEKLYFENLEQDPILMADFFGYYDLNNKKLNILLYFITKYYENKKIKTDANKIDIIYITFLLYTAIEIEKNQKNYKKIVDNLIKNINDKKEFKVKKKYINHLDILYKQIKQNNKLEEQYFLYFENPEFYNIFKRIDNQTYYVKYKYKIEDSNYKKEFIEKIFKKEKTDEEYSIMSYELLSLTLIKTNYNFVIKIPYSFANRINKINQIFYHKRLKERIIFLIEYNNSYKEKELIKALKNNGYKVGVKTDGELLDDEILTIKGNIDKEEYIEEKDILIRKENN